MLCITFVLLLPLLLLVSTAPAATAASASSRNAAMRATALRHANAHTLIRPLLLALRIDV